jgi:hypothetical protein
VAEPREEFRKILRFLDLPFEEAVPSGFGNTEGIPEREYSWKARALEKITTDRVAIFRKELASTELQKLEILGKRALPALGYQLESPLQGRLPLRLLANVGWDLSKLIYSLPWRSLGNEFLARCRAGSRAAHPGHVLDADAAPG